MDRWLGKTAVVTGASSGIGASICVKLANAGMCVVGLARRINLVEKLKSEVQPGKGRIHSRQCDVSKVEEVAAAFKWIEDTFGGTDLLINNAGVLFLKHLTGDDPMTVEQMSATLDTNVKGMMVCTRHAIASMKKRNFDGHIINVNSIFGHYIPSSPLLNMYTSTKHAGVTFTGSLIQELAQLKSKIKVTSFCPGLVDTAMIAEMDGVPMLPPDDIADAMLYVISTPPSVNITDITVSPILEGRH